MDTAASAADPSSWEAAQLLNGDVAEMEFTLQTGSAAGSKCPVCDGKRALHAVRRCTGNAENTLLIDVHLHEALKQVGLEQHMHVTINEHRTCSTPARSFHCMTIVCKV